MTSDEEKAERDTTKRASEWLLEPDGTIRGVEWYVRYLALRLVFKAASPQDQVNPRAEHDFVSWRGSPYVYDASLAEIFIESATKGDYYCDGIVRNAAGLLLDATTRVSDNSLRNYAIKTLIGDIAELKVDSRATRNVFRDQVICLQLMLPLIQQGFRPTRNAATEAECACSICSKALARIKIDLSERRLAEIWNDAISRSPGLQRLTKN